MVTDLPRSRSVRAVPADLILCFALFTRPVRFQVLQNSVDLLGSHCFGESRHGPPGIVQGTENQLLKLSVRVMPSVSGRPVNRCVGKSTVTRSGVAMADLTFLEIEFSCPAPTSARYGMSQDRRRMTQLT